MGKRSGAKVPYRLTMAGFTPQYRVMTSGKMITVRSSLVFSLHRDEGVHGAAIRYAVPQYPHRMSYVVFMDCNWSGYLANYSKVSPMSMRTSYMAEKTLSAKKALNDNVYILTKAEY